jgi:hypothetical protein
LLTEAWNEQGVIYDVVWATGYAIGNTDAVFIVPVAIYLGLLGIFALDRMKKPQAGALVVGTLIGGAILYSRGTLIQPIDWVGNAGWLIGGLAAGGIIGGGRKLFSESWPHEFRRAPALILILLGVVLTAALAEIHILGESSATATPEATAVETGLVELQLLGLLPNLAYSGVYLYIVDKFAQYDYKRDFMVLGPKRGGKTTLMTGSFLEADEMTGSNASASDELVDYQQDLKDAESGFGNVDEPTQAGEFYRLWFNYDFGNWILKNVEVEAIDHGGEVLMDLKAEIDKVSRESLWDRRPKPFKRLYEELAVIAGSLRSIGSDSPAATTRTVSTSSDSEFRTEAHEAVARSVAGADSLVVTIPLVDWVDDTVSEANLPAYYDDANTDQAKRPDRSAYLAEYDKILNWFTNETGADVFVVTTMSDLLLEEFEQRNLNGAAATEESEYRRFEHWINEEVLGREVSRLMEYAVTDDPLAVWFDMNENPHREDGQVEPNPVPEDGEIRFVNGQRLLRQLAS